MNVVFYYNGYYYLPQDKDLLRYLTDGSVSEDYKFCRITVINFNNKVSLTIEEKIPFDIKQLEKQLKLWKSQNIKDYNFDFRWICFCTPDYTRPVNIVVKDNKIDYAVYIDSKEKVKDTSYLMTFDQLFKYVIDAYRNRAWDIKVSYDKRFNFITDNYIDRDKICC